MKDGLKDIIGRQIAAVIVAKSDGRLSPGNQVFLVFTDGANFEFWGEKFTCCGGIDRTRDIERYVKSGRGEIVAVYTNPVTPAPPLSTQPTPLPHHAFARQNLETLMTRDLAAWQLAKQAIFRAMLRAAGRLDRR